MKALVVVALMWTAVAVQAEPAQSVPVNPVAAQSKIDPNMVRPAKVSQCVQERVNLAKGGVSALSSSSTPSAGGYSGYTH